MWCYSFWFVSGIGRDSISSKDLGSRQLSSHFIITTIFTSNFVGIVFARTLHYQFYVWYFHTIPYLLWHAQAIPLVGKFFVFFSIEIAFNVYPATAWSSGLLQVKSASNYLNTLILKLSKNVCPIWHIFESFFFAFFVLNSRSHILFYWGESFYPLRP